MQARGSIGNTLYFYAKVDKDNEKGERTITHKLYKTCLTAGELTLEQVNEFVHFDGLDILPEQPFYSVRKDNELTIYRYEEKAEVDQGRVFDIEGADPSQTSYRLLWRDKLILTQTWQCAEISQLSENVLLLRIPFHVMGSFVHDDCHFLYLLYHSKRFTLLVDPENLAIHRIENAYDPPQPTSAQWGFAPTDIVSVRGDVILYTTAALESPRQNWRAKVPAQYCKK